MTAAMLLGMLTAANASPTMKPTNFASVLASLAAKLDPAGGSEKDDALADDVVVLSYEQALRGRKQFRSCGNEGIGKGPAARMTLHSDARRTQGIEESPLERDSDVEPVARCSERKPAANKRQMSDRKAASVTIRLSESECAQVHARAAEAGMTMSAYLRSCVFEAESLRAQVKVALAELRAEGNERTEHMASGAAPESGEERGWRAKLFPRWRKREAQS
jgi:predicted DNA binding CopG/RHH family protein